MAFFKVKKRCQFCGNELQDGKCTCDTWKAVEETKQRTEDVKVDDNAK